MAHPVDPIVEWTLLDDMPIPQDLDLSFLAPPRSSGELGRLAHYRIRKVLGRGAMGAVFLAEDTLLGRKVALKVIPPGKLKTGEARDQILREARLAARLQHDHVVTIHQVGEDRGVPFFAMQLLKGCTVEDWMARGHRPAVMEILRIGREATLGIAAAHAAGLIHRDLKPGNLWLEAPAERVKILDFGLARCVVEENTRLTLSGMVVGTPAYIAPEQARTLSYDHRADLFSLGCILYEMCTCRRPFMGETAMSTIIAATIEEPVPVRELNPDVPPALADLIRRLMAKEPEDRPATAHEVADELAAMEDRYLRGEGSPRDTVRLTAPFSAVTPTPRRPGANSTAELAIPDLTPTWTGNALSSSTTVTDQRRAPPSRESSLWFGVGVTAFVCLLIVSIGAIVWTWQVASHARLAKAANMPTKQVKSLSAEEAGRHVDEECTLEFYVASITGQTKVSLNNRATEEESTFVALLSDRCLSQMQQSEAEAKAAYAGKVVRITGRVTLQHSTPSPAATRALPHIVIDDPSQLVVLDSAVGK